MTKTMNERFEERFPLQQLHDYHELTGHIARKGEIADFIQSEIDLERKRIVEIIENELEISCVDDRLLGKTDEYLQGYNKSTDRWREKRDDIINLITNK